MPTLKHLNTKWIDLYLIHAPNHQVLIEETLQAMNDLRKQGCIKYLGVSNFTKKDLERALNYPEHNIIANQVEYSLLSRNRGGFTRNTESEIIPFCNKKNIRVFAHRPLGKGVLANIQNVTLENIAKKYQKTKAQIALNWVICKGTLPHVKAVHIEHIKENLGALHWRLTPEDIKELDDAFRT